MSLANLITAANAVTVTQLGTDGQAVINDAVAAAQGVEGGDTAKFESAVSKAGTDLVALGKDVGLEIIHLAIEATVAALNPTVSVSADIEPALIPDEPSAA